MRACVRDRDRQQLESEVFAVLVAAMITLAVGMTWWFRRSGWW
jgi:Mg2+ and Co2+ transporter CorA